MTREQRIKCLRMGLAWAGPRRRREIERKIALLSAPRPKPPPVQLAPPVMRFDDDPRAIRDHGSPGRLPPRDTGHPRQSALA